MRCGFLAVSLLFAKVHAAVVLDDEISKIKEKHDLKSITVALIKGGTTYTKAMGVKDCDGNQVDTNTAYMLASSSKTYAGLAAAIAMEKGLLSLDGDVSDIMPYTVRNPGYPSSKITLRQFLTHRSSMANYAPALGNDEPSYAPPPLGTNPSCPLDNLSTWYNDLLVDRPSQSGYGGTDVPNWYKLAYNGEDNWESCQPGRCHEYSNLGSGFVGAMVEEAWDQGNFQQFCNTYIFDPLKLTNTAWFSESLPDSANEAHPFKNDKCHPNYCFADYPSGSLRTSANDMARYLQMMLNQGTLDGEQIISKETWRQMTTCQEHDETNTPVDNEDCLNGFFWFLLDQDDHGYMSNLLSTPWSELKTGIMHDGSELGVSTEFLVLPDQNMAVGVTTNTGNADSPAILRDLVALLKDMPDTPPTTAPTTVPTTAPTDGFDWGPDACASGEGSFTREMPVKGEIVDIGIIPAGKFGVRVQLDSDTDLDIQLYDVAENSKFPGGAAVVGWCPETKCNFGKLAGPKVETKTYVHEGIEAMDVTYSGYNGVKNKVGVEYIEITGETSTDLRMAAYAYQTGFAKVTYSWKCGGSFNRFLKEGEIVAIGNIPPGKREVHIKLTASTDLDIQVYDREDTTQFSEGKAIIAWKACGEPSSKCNAGILKDKGYAETSYEGAAYSWSGYNGEDGIKTGHETVTIDMTNRDLTMSAYSYKEGTAVVKYSFRDN